MKAEKLYEAIGGIDERLIAEAGAFKKKSEKKRIVPFIVSSLVHGKDDASSPK